MTTRRYALSKGERRRLTLSWGIFYSNFTVRLDDQIIGTIPDQLSLNSGKGFQLEDGSQLFIYRESSQIKISRNGRPLPGSAADPQVKLNIAMGAIAFVCLASVFFGLVGGSTYNPQKSSLTIGIMIGSGLLYGVLAFFVRSRSKIALGIAVGLYGLDTLGIIILLLGRTPGSYIVALGEHILFLFLMWRGFSAIDDLNAGDYSSQPSDGILQPLPARFPNSADTVMAPDYAAPSFLSQVTTFDDAKEPTPSADQLLKQAVEIVQSGGDRGQAKSLVNAALKSESRNADGWYLAAYLADTKAERKAALERTLTLNPNHKRAQQEFARLTNA